MRTRLYIFIIKSKSRVSGHYWWYNMLSNNSMIHQGVSFISGWVYVIYFKVNGISHKLTSRLYPGSNRARLWEPFRVSMIILIVSRKTIIPPTKQQKKKKKLKPLSRYRDIAFNSKFAYATWCHLVYDKLKRGE